MSPLAPRSEISRGMLVGGSIRFAPNGYAVAPRNGNIQVMQGRLHKANELPLSRLAEAYEAPPMKVVVDPPGKVALEPPRFNASAGESVNQSSEGASSAFERTDGRSRARAERRRASLAGTAVDTFPLTRRPSFTVDDTDVSKIEDQDSDPGFWQRTFGGRRASTQASDSGSKTQPEVEEGGLRPMAQFEGTLLARELIPNLFLGKYAIKEGDYDKTRDMIKITIKLHKAKDVPVSDLFFTSDP
jgi:hypothetical protein